MLAPLPGLCLSEKGREPYFTGPGSAAFHAQLLLSGYAHIACDTAFGFQLAFASALASVQDVRRFHNMRLLFVVSRLSCKCPCCACQEPWWIPFVDLLLDEVPTREFGHTVGMFVLQSILHLHSVGVALLGLAHLVTLVKYGRAFLQKASAKYPAGSGLRAPNSVELEWADKQLWGEIASLLEKGWTFDDSVHEVVHVRSPIQSYLQPRPVAASVPPAPFRQGGQGKADWGAGKSSTGRGRGGKKGGKGRGSPASGKGTGSDRPPRQQWMARFGKRTLCMLWNQGKCDLENCQYEHLCCVAANGKPCLGNRRAGGQLVSASV